jgi:hypothetical protein
MGERPAGIPFERDFMGGGTTLTSTDAAFVGS